MQSQNVKRQNSKNKQDKQDDKSWRCFRNFINVHMWDGFVYLFIVVCDSENDLNYLIEDFNEMRSRIFHLNRHSGAGEDKYITTNEVIDQYLESRMRKNEELRNKVMLSVFK